MDNGLIRKTFTSETKAENKSRSLIVKISSNTPDRSRDVVMPKGVDLKNYLKNPVVLLSHDYHGLAVAKTVDIQVNDNDITAKVLFPDQGVSPVSDTVYALYKDGFMSAWSIGFMPTKYEDLADGGKQFNEWELLEFSAVSVPDNPEALTILRSKGLDTSAFEKTISDEPEDEEVKPEPEETPVVEETEPVVEPVVETPTVEPAPEPEEKSAKVITGKTKKTIMATIESMQLLSTQLQSLLDLTQADSTDEQKNVLSLVDALKLADQVVGRALRDYKQGK